MNPVKRIERLSITQEITLSVVSVFFLMISLLGFIVAHLLISNNDAKLEWQKKTNLEIASTLLQEPMWTLDVPNIENAISIFISENYQVIGIRVLDAYSHILTEKIDTRYSVYSFEELKNKKNHFFVDGQVKRNGENLGKIEFIYSTQRFVDETVWQITMLCMLFLCTGLLFGFIILWHLKKTITAPVSRIVAGSKMMAQGNYNFQVENEPVAEFQEMSETLNLAIKAIRDRDNKLKQNLEEVQQATRAKSKFVSTMSHEIRTPLNAIMGLTELTLETDLSAEQRENLETVKLSANSLLHIINDILDFSKIEADKILIEMTPFSFIALMNECIQIVYLSASQKNINLKMEFANDLDIDLIGDPLRIRQVILNFLNNAIKFTPENGHVTLRLVNLVDSNTYSIIRLEVEDTGIGIKPTDIEKLFEAFNQLDQTRTRKFGGSGLGLSISKKLVELMGGVIGVESKINQGSRFWFQLKLNKKY